MTHRRRLASKCKARFIGGVICRGLRGRCLAVVIDLGWCDGQNGEMQFDASGGSGVTVKSDGKNPEAGGIRARLRQFFFEAMRRVAGIDDTREILAEMLRAGNAIPAPGEMAWMGRESRPYGDLGQTVVSAPAPSRAAVFVTGRFRSGSTLMWNIFRHVPGVTSYYEPFNERRWFDVGGRGVRVDQTHLGVSDYWVEYDHLSELGQYFDEAWKFRRLYMYGTSYDAPMQRYIETMIERAPGRPVLQFNEVDFRLGWLRAWFPGVPIIHIFRHPRDQWCSTLQEAAKSAAQCRLRDFQAYDGFYLLRWARDLRLTFPFLSLDGDAFAYELYYQVWKLSYLFGQRYAELSLRFEDLIADPRSTIRKILETAGMPEVDVEPLVRLVSPVRTGKWRECADADWFSEIEARVDATIARYVGAVSAAQRSNTSVVRS